MATSRQSITLMTAEDLLALPDDDKQYELVEGVLIEMSPSSRHHSRDGLRIATRLNGFVEDHDLGEVHGADGGFILRRNPDTVRSPDAAFVRKERLVELDDEGYLPLAPDLAVEVVSPSNTVNEMSRKVQEYLSAGTSTVWVVEPLRRQVAVHTQEPVVRIFRDGDTLDGGDVLPGFTLSVTYIFDGTQASR
ncbi:MAG TPA: Uma2 family endonuclease [Thermomicrobiales bacterium]|nr:Uma2 family endonuclease [Thermomicrobiales bacterium]